MKELIIFGIGFFGGFFIACIIAANKIGVIQEYYMWYLRELEKGLEGEDEKNA